MRKPRPSFSWQRKLPRRDSQSGSEVTSALTRPRMAARIGFVRRTTAKRAPPREGDAAESWTPMPVRAMDGNVVLLASPCTSHWRAKKKQHESGYRKHCHKGAQTTQGGISAGSETSTYHERTTRDGVHERLARRSAAGQKSWGKALLKNDSAYGCAVPAATRFLQDMDSRSSFSAIRRFAVRQKAKPEACIWNARPGEFDPGVDVPLGTSTLAEGPLRCVLREHLFRQNRQAEKEFP